MSSDIAVRKLGDLLEITSSKRIHMADYVSSGIPFWRGKEVIERAKGGQISTELFITENQFREIDRKFGSPQNGDILLTSVGTLGVPYLVDNDGKFYFKDGNVTWFRKFSDEVDSRFLYYWLNAPATQKKLDQISIGSTQKALTIVALKGLEIPLPARDLQAKIVAVLDALSSKIALLHGTNATLEAIAQALFKSWFVDFEPVRAKQEGREPEGMDAETAALFPDRFVESQFGLVPCGWRTLAVNDIAVLFSGGTPDTRKPEYWHGEIPWFSSGETREDFVVDTEKRINEEAVKNSSTKLALPGDILIASAGQGHTRGQTSYCAIETYINQSVVSVRSIRSQCDPIWLFYNLKRRYTEMRDISDSHSSRGSLTTKLLGSLKVALPTTDIANAFVSIVDPLVQSQINTARSVGVLSQLRDTLLPRLISGQLRLPDAEEEFNDVLTGT